MNDSEQLLEDAIAELRRRPVPAFPRDAIVPFALKSKHRTGERLSRGGRHVVSLSSRVAVAALVALVIGVVLWHGGPLAGEESFALGQVGEAVDRVRSVRYKLTNTGWKGQPWPDPYVRKIQILEPGRFRTDDENDVTVLDAQKGRYVRLRKKEKKAVIQPLYAGGSAVMQSVNTFPQELRALATGAKEQVNRTEADGRQVVEFRWSRGDDEFLVVADAETKLPITMSIDHGKRGGKHIREVYSDFVFDGPMDESEFEVDIPDGYSVEEWKPDPNNSTYPDQDAEQLVVSHEGFGPVRPGMTAEEINRLLGSPDWIAKQELSGPKPSPTAPDTAGGGEMVTLDFSSRGFSLTLLPNGTLTVQAYSQVAQGPLVRDFVGRTEEGVRVSDSRDKVIELYGQPETELSGSMQYVRKGWLFHIQEGRVVGFSTSRPTPPRDANGVQSRVLKDGTVIQVPPGVDIDAMLDEEGNLRVKKPPSKLNEP